MYVDRKSRVIVDSQRFCESARQPAWRGKVIRMGSGDMGRQSQTRKWSYKHDKLTQCCRALNLSVS